MKKIPLLSAVALISVESSHADVVYIQDFDATPSLAFIAERENSFLGGSAGTNDSTVVLGDFFGATNGVNISSGALNFTNLGDGGRSRGMGIWLDSSGWALGDVTVTFDITGHAPGGSGDAETVFQAYFADGFDTATSSNGDGVSLDLHEGTLVTQSPDLGLSGNAQGGRIGSVLTFNTVSTGLSVTFDYTGNDAIGLVFYNDANGSDPNATFSVDNIVVETIPEPSSALLVGLSAFAFMLRRRR